MDNENLYKNPMGLTQQFRHCGNPFRIDSYRGCSFGCEYCFAANRGGNISFKPQVADISIIEKNFKKAFDTDKKATNITIEMLRHRVPLHLGGMSDPFQSREFSYGATKRIIEISNKYNYPLVISTKQCFLPNDYWEILNPNLHAFQISLFTDNDEVIRKFEHNTPSPMQRIAFMKELKSKNFWVGVRMQPLIDIDGAISLTEKVSNFVDYITVEHLKICNDNRPMAIKLFNLCGHEISDYKTTGRNYELKTDIKKKNIDKIKAVSKCKIGCGDNDLHEYSDSNNCCGVDTINFNFDNWNKYNSMNIKMTNTKNYWFPKNNCSGCFNSECVIKDYNFKDYVDHYMEIGIKEKKCNFKM